MPASITIAPNYFGQETRIEFLLIDQYGTPYVAELVDGSGFIGGYFELTVDAAGAEFELPCNDEIPAPPGQPGESSQWLIRVDYGRQQAVYQVAISSSAAPTDWNELIGAGLPVDPAEGWGDRLLPSDATDGQTSVWDDGAGAWVPADNTGLNVVAFPAAADSTGRVGDIAFDSDHIAICLANDTWYFFSASAVRPAI